MVKSTQRPTEDNALALYLAEKATKGALSELATLSSTARNSPETYQQLGLVSETGAAPVIAYILSQTKSEEDVALLALKALSSIHTPNAEKAIVKIAKSILGTSKKFADNVGAYAIGALQEIGSETAADSILELAHGDDDLIYQALTSLGALYDADQHRFGSAYKRILAFSLQPDILDKVVVNAIGNKGEKLLSEAFAAADARRVLPELESVKDRSPCTVGFATCAFDLAKDMATMRRDMQGLQVVREQMMLRLGGGE